MRFEPGYIFGMMLQTVPEPRKVARDLFNLGLPRETLWTALALVIVLNAALGIVSGMLFAVDAGQMAPILSSPILLGVIEAAFMFGLSWAIYLIGRACGGQGGLSDAITTVVWMELIFLLLQAATLFLAFFAPAMVAIAMFISVFLFFWILSQFTTESHGFRSVGLVFVSILGCLILAVFALSFVLMLAGVQPIDMPIPS